MPPIRRIMVLAVDGALSLDIMGPVDVFDYAELQVPGSYKIDVVGPATDGHVTMSNGIRLAVDPLPEPPPRHDTLARRRGRGRPRAPSTTPPSWTGSRALRARRAAPTSVCTGSYLLAATGLLDGHRATTHWAFCDGFRQRFPEVELDPDAGVHPRRGHLDIGGRHRRHRPRAGAGRGRPRRRRSRWPSRV